MPSRRDLNRLGDSQAALVAAARRELERFLLNLPSDPVLIRRELEEFFPLLVQAYGDAGMTVAADWFERTAPSPGRAVVVPGSPVPAAQARATAEWAARQYAAGELARVLAGPLQRYLLRPGRDTLRLSAAASGAGWARVPRGAKTCAFCLMLASRGAVYESERTARYAQDGDRYHDLCNCQPTPVWSPDDYPEGYDPDALYDEYRAARAAAGSGDPRAITRELRARGSVTDAHLTDVGD